MRGSRDTHRAKAAKAGERPCSTSNVYAKEVSKAHLFRFNNNNDNNNNVLNNLANTKSNN